MIDEVLAKLSPEHRKLLERGSDVKIHKQETPLVGLNRALKGGLAYGRQVLIYGSKSAGKSTFCLQLCARAQQDGKTCAWIDVEGSYDPNWAERLGVDNNEMIVSSANQINKIVDVVTSLMDAKVDIVVIDSISSALPAVFFEKKGELKDLADTKQMGSDARDWAHAVKMFGYANQNTLLILISQQRKALGSMHVANIPTGGEAVKFSSSTIIKLFSSGTENNSIKDTVQLGNREIEIPIGRTVTWTIDANKTGPALGTGSYRLYYEGDFVGIDSTEELVSELELHGIMTRVTPKGAYYDLFDKRYQGRDNVVNILKNDPELRERCVQAL